MSVEYPQGGGEVKTADVSGVVLFSIKEPGSFNDTADGGLLRGLKSQ